MPIYIYIYIYNLFLNAYGRCFLSGLSEEAEEKAIEEAEQKAESSYIKSSICDYWKGHQVGICFPTYITIYFRR